MIDIALCGDRRILPGMAVTVRSALENASCKMNVHIIADGLTRKDKENLVNSWDHANCGAVEFFELSPEKLRGFRATLYLKSKAAYARFYIPEAFPNLKRCVYLDGDIIVLRDLAELLAPLRDRLGLRDERNYFNSGVMYFDCERWRAEHLTESLIDLSRTRTDILHAQDQDALNIVLEDRVLLIDPTWNTSQYEKPHPLAGHIVHLIGPIKPWHKRYRQKYQTETYYRDVILATFKSYLSRTRFDGWSSSRFGSIGEYVYARTPTLEMVVGKFRRLAG